MTVAMLPRDYFQKLISIFRLHFQLSCMPHILKAVTATSMAVSNIQIHTHTDTQTHARELRRERNRT